MAELNFPASPTDGQIYGNFIWSAATGAWLARPQPQSVAVSSPTAPTSPVVNTLWYNTNDGNTYIYNYDGDSYQWVQLKSDATLSSTLGSRVDALDYGANVNYIINGGMDVWQRGTSFSAAGYTADRWIVLADGTGATRAITQQAFTPGNAIAGYEPTFFLRYNQSVAGSSATYNIIEQRVEDVRTLAGQAVTVSFWAKSDANRTITAQVQQNFGSGGSAEVQAIATQSIALTTSWQRFTYTATMPSITGKTIGTNSYVAVRINLPNNATFTVDIWGVQFQKGNTVTDFHRSMPTIQGELAACQRYYQRFANTGANAGAVPLCGSIGFASSATAGWIVVQPLVTLRTNLTSNSQVSFSSVSFDNQATYGSSITGIVLNDNGGVRQTQNAISLKLTGMSGLTTNAPYWLITSSTTGYVSFDVEL